MGDFVEEHARRAVQLADNHALGAVDDKRPTAGDQGQFAQEDILLDDILDLFLPVALIPDG
jgi:hypothetical protein